MVHQLSCMIVVAICLCSCSVYDVGTPDTRANRSGFKQHLKFTPSEAVSDVYYYADEMGADVQYQLSFRCDKATIDLIVKTLSLVQAPDDFEKLAPRDDLKWWGPESTEGRTLWIKEKTNQYYWQLWYSEEDERAFYHEYSL